MRHIQREILIGDAALQSQHILSYITDYMCPQDTRFPREISIRPSYTIAKGTGSSYVYPRAMYIYGDKTSITNNFSTIVSYPYYIGHYTYIHDNDVMLLYDHHYYLVDLGGNIINDQDLLSDILEDSLISSQTPPSTTVRFVGTFNNGGQPVALLYNPRRQFDGNYLYGYYVTNGPDTIYNGDVVKKAYFNFFGDNSTEPVNIVPIVIYVFYYNNVLFIRNKNGEWFDQYYDVVDDDVRELEQIYQNPTQNAQYILPIPTPYTPPPSYTPSYFVGTFDYEGQTYIVIYTNDNGFVVYDIHGVPVNNDNDCTKEALFYYGLTGPNTVYVAASPGNNTHIQIYPPIICSGTLKNVRGTNNNGEFVLFLNNKVAIIGDMNNTHNSYIFPGVFWVTYGGRTSTPSSYYNAYIPSFDTSQPNSTRHAFFTEAIFIKDPLLSEKKIPTQEINRYTTNSEANQYWTHFEVKLNTDVLHSLKSSYLTTHYPIAYNKIGNNNVIRRQFADLDQTTCSFHTTYIPPTSSGTFEYNFRYYCNGVEINNANNVAIISPIDGRGSRRSGLTDYTNGSDPAYFYPGRPNSPDNSVFSWPEYTVSTGESQFSQDKFDYFNNSLFNFFLIKVGDSNGNSPSAHNMNAFGQQSKFYNAVTYVGPNDAACDYTDVRVVYSNYFGARCILPKISSTDGSVTYIGNTPIFGNKFTTQAFSGLNFHNIRLNIIGDSKSFSYMTYENARGSNTTYDVASVSSIHINNGNYNLTQINMKHQPQLQYVSLQSSNYDSMPTYTYCYLAANVMRGNGNNTLFINRVLSSTYICIKKEKIENQNQTNGTYVTSYPRNEDLLNPIRPLQ